MRYFKATQDYVVAVSCHQSQSSGSLQLILSVVPQHLDVWSWEEHYKEVSLQKVDWEPPPTQASAVRINEEEDSRPGIFEHKELLNVGESLGLWKTSRTKIHDENEKFDNSIVCTLQVENWSRYRLEDPEINLVYGKQSKLLPIKSVPPGYTEITVLEQDQSSAGISGIIRWKISSTSTVLSLMISVPYSQLLWSSWISAGITSNSSLPNYRTMYSGTPDSSWFIRQKMGQRLEFTINDLILVVESKEHKYVSTLNVAVVPLDPDKVAGSIKEKLETGVVYSKGLTPQKKLVLALISKSPALSKYFMIRMAMTYVLFYNDLTVLY